MSNVRFIADLHFGHKNMAIKRGFANEEEHDEYIISQWNKAVHKKDLVYILGDISMETKTHYNKLDKLNGKKIVVLGNHDMKGHVRELLNHVESVAGMIRYNQKGFPKSFITHCPIHPSELEYRVGYNIHGHLHENNVLLEDSSKDERYICVSCEHVNYQPKLFKELIKKES